MMRCFVFCILLFHFDDHIANERGLINCRHWRDIIGYELLDIDAQALPAGHGCVGQWDALLQEGQALRAAIAGGFLCEELRINLHQVVDGPLVMRYLENGDLWLKRSTCFHTFLEAFLDSTGQI